MTLTVEDLRRLLRPTQRRISHMVSRGKLTMVDDGRGLQRSQVEVLDGETRDNVERFQQYGFSSNPPAGAEALMLSLGGSRDHPVIVAIDDRKSRPRDRKAGETELYNDLGLSVRLGADRIVTIEAPGGGKVQVQAPMEVNGSITVTAPGGKVRIVGDLEVTGEIKDRCESDGRTMENMRELHNAHIHPGTAVPVEKM